MPRRLYITNLALALLLAVLLSWLVKVKIVDELKAQQKQIQAQIEQIQALTASLESLLKIVNEFKKTNNPGA